MPLRILVIAPHPDDETLACGGTIAKKIKEGHDVRIVFLTDGRNSHLHTLEIYTDPSPEQLALIRVQEAQSATAILGVPPENLIFLDLTSDALVDGREAVIKTIRQVFLGIMPDEIYYPDGLDSHRTHKAAYTILRNVLEQVDSSPQEFRYIVWRDAQAWKMENVRNISVDVSEVIHLKRLAIAEYKSQVTVFSKYQRQPLLSEAFLQDFLVHIETFYR